MKRLLLTGLACAVFAAAPASAETYKLLSSWDRTLKPAFSVAELMQKLVAEVSGGKTKVEIFGPETVPPFQQIQPVASGVFDILYTHGAYHFGSKGIALAGDAIDGDPAKRRASGVWKFVDDYYQKNNGLKLISMTVSGTHGYQCYLRAPLSPAGDWAGRKLRGVVSYHGVIRALGGTPVVLPVADIYSALEKGVVDGSCLTANGMFDIKHHEVAKYRIEPTFGVATTIVAVNVAKWGKAPAEDRAALLKAGERLEIEAPKAIDAMLTAERAELARQGVKVETLSPEKGRLIRKAWNDSQWELAKQCCGEASAELKAIAEKAGITN